MWGICLDCSTAGGSLFQRAVEYQLDSEAHTANILQPVKIAISADKMMTVDKPPVFVYGDLVSPINHHDRIGRIETIIWHFKNEDYCYYITVNGRKISKRYYTEELMKI